MTKDSNMWNLFIFLKQIISKKIEQVIYLIGALIGIGACLLVWFGSGDIFHSYGIYGVAALFGMRENESFLELEYFPFLKKQNFFDLCCAPFLV